MVLLFAKTMKLHEELVRANNHLLVLLFKVTLIEQMVSLEVVQIQTVTEYCKFRISLTVKEKLGKIIKKFTN